MGEKQKGLSACTAGSDYLQRFSRICSKTWKKTGYTKNDCVSVCENTTCIRADFSPKHNDMLRIILKVTGNYNSLAVFSLAGFYV